MFVQCYLIGKCALAIKTGSLYHLLNFFTQHIGSTKILLFVVSQLYWLNYLEFFVSPEFN